MTKRKRIHKNVVRKHLGRILSFVVGAMLGVVFFLHLVSWATGPVFLFPGSQVLFEWGGRPWCTNHSWPLPMYEGLRKEVASTDCDGIHASVVSPWKCWLCGSNWDWRKRVPLREWLHGKTRIVGSGNLIRLR